MQGTYILQTPRATSTFKAPEGWHEVPHSGPKNISRLVTKFSRSGDLAPGFVDLWVTH